MNGDPVDDDLQADSVVRIHHLASAEIDQGTGTLTLIALLATGSPQGASRLRIDLSPDAAYHFLRALRAAESVLDAAVLERPEAAPLH